ncbi:MAG: amino acid ABC transporter substrate-binding protein [Thermoleophilia bacterium]|nr:amino acid ABC transporter substrate-binding protein [Thermoleophilia bacterium]
MRKLLLILLVAALAAFAAGCGSDDEESAPATGETATEAADVCAKENLETKTPGRLTIGTDNPAYPPWFEVSDSPPAPWELGDPTSGEGFESAVAYAVAEELGFSEDEVDWTVVPFDQSFRPGPKDFDFDINQISYSDERAQAVDFSDSYYDVNQALVALEANPVADATSVADLKGAKLGAPVGTTSYQYIVDNIEPDAQPSVYNTLNDAISAVQARQIDGVVVDLPTAFFITAAQLENSTIVGQFPSVGEQEYFAMSFEKGSPLVDCVNAALARLKDDGRLAEIQQEWLSDKADAPVLE